MASPTVIVPSAKRNFMLHYEFTNSTIRKQTTMTLSAKPTAADPSGSNKKESLRRAVCFSQCAKYTAPSKQSEKSNNVEKGLQADNKGRRYMRRGSKCPSMLILSFKEKNHREEAAEAVPSITALASMELKQRRLSLMSALKTSLEKATLIESESSRGLQPSDKKQLYDFLSEI